MHFKKMLFITAMTLGLATSTAYAQEQTTEGEQAVTEVIEVIEAVTEETAPAEAVADEAEAEIEAETAPEAMPVKATGPEGMWIRRKKGEQIRVEFRDDAMYCTIINRTKKSGKAKKDFEMCHGMTAEEGAWKGKKMKHPDMPKFMTFKGTVTVEGDVLKIKGCAGICDSEKWDRAPAEG